MALPQGKADALALAYMPLLRYLHKLMLSQVPRWVDPDELFSAGQFHLLLCSRRYNPKRGNFAFFAGRRMVGAMIDAIRQMDLKPVEIRKLEQLRKRIYEVLTQELCRKPNAEDVFEILGQEIIAPLTVSISDAVGKDDSYRPFNRHETLFAKTRPPRNDLFDEATFCLDTREKMILWAAIYLRRTNQEIAQFLTLGTQRVSELRCHAIRRIRETVNRDELLAIFQQEEVDVDD